MGLFVLKSSSADAAEPLGADKVVLAATSAEQFALMGGVFLILGGAFVFAPQIVSAVNGFFARLFGREVKPRKPPQPQPQQQTQQIHPPTAPGAEHTAPPLEDHSQWAPPPESEAEAEPELPPGKAVSRLRDEISSAWGRQQDA